MAELSAARTTAHSCCVPEAQASCCEPSARADCCGESHASGGCGCDTGKPADGAATDIREQLR
jgi:arsenite methyltransferase